MYNPLISFLTPWFLYAVGVKEPPQASAVPSIADARRERPVGENLRESTPEKQLEASPGLSHLRVRLHGKDQGKSGLNVAQFLNISKTSSTNCSALQGSILVHRRFRIQFDHQGLLRIRIQVKSFRIGPPVRVPLVRSGVEQDVGLVRSKPESRSGSPEVELSGQYGSVQERTIRTGRVVVELGSRSARQSDQRNHRLQRRQADGPEVQTH
ncbi:hypothetical protein EYF80_012561 [Liparis tanakae]|uniref:Uncharacterized protein n=1 Tax=Liparis tanakae TaxID=230148 RepID=A0A4Z2IIJ8_9TELE|nr:hypothetical protein EYF80_012561 [Liparis tanakae]